MMRLINTVAYLFIFSTLLPGQVDTTVFLGYFDNQNIKLRWISNDWQQLKTGFENGYQIEIEERDVFNASLNMYRYSIEPIDTNRVNNFIESALDSAAINISKEILNASGVFQAIQEKNWQTAGLLVAVQENFELSKALGLAYEISNPDTNHIYLFRLYLGSSQDAPLIKSLTLRYPEIPFLPEPPEPLATCENNRITLTGVVGTYSNIYGSFHVEKKGPDQTEFVQVNTTPLIANYQFEEGYIYYIDSIDKNGPTQYRFKGKDMWGRMGPESQTETIYPCHLIFQPPHPFSAFEVQERGKVKLIWSIPDTLKEEIKAFRIFRADNKFGNYIHLQDSIIPPHQFSFIDINPLAICYYIVEVQYSNNLKKQSLSVPVQLIDTKAPEPPQNISVEFDTTDFISTISWTPNTEMDFKGYRVYFAYSLQEEKKLIYNFEIEENFYIDTIPKDLLHEQCYYWITARDYNQNESWFSDSVWVKLPDRYPPIPATIVGFDFGSDELGIQWQTSPSEDIDYYELQRKANTSEVWSTIETVSDNPAFQLSSIDTSLEPMDTMDYRVMAVDTNGLVSYSEIKRGWLLEKIYLPSIEYLSIERSDSSSMLFFDYPSDIDIFRFQIYGGSQSRGLTTIEYAYPSEHTFRSDVTKQNQTGTYNLYRIEIPFSRSTASSFQVKAISNQGKVSPLTPIAQAQ